MSYSVSGTTIKLTRGDTCAIKISIFNSDGTPYEIQEGDSIRFAMKASYTDDEALLIKDIPTDTMTLVLEPDDTKPFEFGRYVYDIQLTTEGGIVSTFITKSFLRLEEEVE